MVASPNTLYHLPLVILFVAKRDWVMKYFLRVQKKTRELCHSGGNMARHDNERSPAPNINSHSSYIYGAYNMPEGNFLEIYESIFIVLSEWTISMGMLHFGLKVHFWTSFPLFTLKKS